MNVTATAKGHYQQIREAGDSFEFPDSALKKGPKGENVFPSWFVKTKGNEEIIQEAKERRAEDLV